MQHFYAYEDEENGRYLDAHGNKMTVLCGDDIYLYGKAEKNEGCAEVFDLQDGLRRFGLTEIPDPNRPPLPPDEPRY